MNKEIKNFGKVIEICLIVLTFISLIINAFIFTNSIYNCTYDTLNLNSLVISNSFNILFWVDNILIFLLNIFYIIDTIQKKENLLLKLSFSLFSICTTIIVSNFIINFIAKIFKIF